MPPAAPRQLAVVRASATRVDLTWTNLATTQTGYRVDRRDVGGVFQPIMLLGPQAVSYSDVAAPWSVAFEYQVVALNASGESLPSNLIRLESVPVTPSQLTATPSPGGRAQVSLAWSHPLSLWGIAFEVRRRQGTAGFVT